MDYIRYTSLKNAGEISVTIEVLQGDSSFTDMPAPGIIYKNMNIWVGKTGYATESNIDNPVIGFRLSREWIGDNDIDPATIAIYRYNDGWAALTTKQTGSDEKYLYFEAISGLFTICHFREKIVTDSNEEIISNQVNAGSSLQPYSKDTTVPEENKACLQYPDCLQCQ
ncbi:MAG: PGF-pre-PGF domain-containing protein [Methanolobus sp.]